MRRTKLISSSLPNLKYISTQIVVADLPRMRVRQRPPVGNTMAGRIVRPLLTIKTLYKSGSSAAAGAVRIV